MYLPIKYLLAIFTILIILCSCGFFLDASAKTKKDDILTRVEGKGCFVYGDQDTPASAKEKALMLARREAIESHKTLIIAKSSIDKLELNEDIIDTLAAGHLYKTKILDVAEDGREIFFHQTDLVDADFDSLEEEQQVEFDVEKGTKGPKAVSVKLSTE